MSADRRFSLVFVLLHGLLLLLLIGCSPYYGPAMALSPRGYSEDSADS